MNDDWIFDDPKNVAVFTTKKIVYEGFPILYVSHDDEDGAWQFLDGDDVETENAALISLSYAVKIDPSLKELANLPYGWIAWRPSPDVPWQRAPQPQTNGTE